MGIVFYARRISEPLEQRLLLEPALTEQLTDPACDFDRAVYLRPFEEQGKALPEGLFARAERLEAERTRLWEKLVRDRVAPRDVDAALEIEAAWLGLSWGFAGTRACELLFGEGGTPVGEDVGYGPARVLTNHQVRAVRDELVAVDVIELATRFHDGFVAWGRSVDISTAADAEHLSFALTIAARTRLVAYLRDATSEYRALLVWSQ
jgi:hypothetical protein